MRAAGYGVQQRYNIAYAQCMAAHGNKVPQSQAAYGPPPRPYYLKPADATPQQNGQVARQ